MEKIRLTGSSSSIQRLTETYLTDDFWYEIFLHLPIDSIYKFRCVSKVWLSILSNPNFMNKWDKLNTASLWTLVHAGFSCNEIPDHSSTIKFTYSYPELTSQFMSRHYDGFSFMFLNQTHDFSDSDLYIVGSSKGLVLCTTDFFIQVTYYVCNPLTKRWVSLPPPPTREGVVAGFTCEEEPCSSSLTFKVIRVRLFSRATGFKVDIFSSDLGKWSVYNILNPPDGSWNFSAHDNFVTLDGVFYWMQKKNNIILAFSVNRNNIHGAHENECRLIKLPDRVSMGDMNICLCQCLGESEGLICYATVEPTDMSLSVWVLKEDWCLLHKDINFYRMLSQIESWLIGVGSTAALIRKIQVLCFNLLDKNVVILVYEKYVWAYNIRTGGYQELSHLSFTDSNLSTPYMSILTFGIKPRPTMLPPVRW